ncbi:putative gustatory receptor 39b [Prorops nasuta]|uniref:putative gustatory receptor 39b n=1 Tax=Prorops nasuta TaxID=863751 RepID=UPI0034CEDBC9
METDINIQLDCNVITVERFLRPITYTSWILGVGISRPKKASKCVTIIFRILHFAICSVIVAYGAIDFFTFGSVFKSDIFKIMYYTNKVVCYVSSYYYIYDGIRHYDKWPELMRKIQNIDEKIEREIPINNQLVRKTQILALLATVMIGPLSLLIHAFYYYFILPEDIFASDLLLYYTISQSVINSFHFNIVVLVISQRFKAINEMIENIDQTFPSSWISLKLRRARELHSGNCDIVTFVNGLYGLQLLLSSANSFTMVVATLFRIYMGVVEQNYEFMLINNIIWMIYVGQFALTCCNCNIASRESNKTGIIIYSIILYLNKNLCTNKLKGFTRGNEENYQTNPVIRSERHHPIEHQGNFGFDLNYLGIETLLRATNERDSIRSEVNDFSLQISQHSVTFTACDFFEMNNSLLSGFVGVITTYLIILVQFYRPEHHDK